MNGEQPGHSEVTEATGTVSPSSRTAAIAMWLGIIGIVFVPFAIAAFVMGRRFLDQVDDSAEGVAGRAQAKAAVVLGVVGVVVLAVGLILPVLGAARRSARCVQNTTQLRGITQGAAAYASTNGDYFPGLDSEGRPVDVTVEGRFRLMIENNLFGSKYILSPSDTKTIWTTGPITTDNYSFAMLDISEDNARRSAWRAELGSQAILFSDRNSGVSNDPADVMSIHTDRPGVWKGQVAYADAHAIFVQDYRLPTRYGDTAGYEKDHIFEQSGGDDAAMIYSGE